MIEKNYANPKLNSIASLIRDSRIYLVTDKEKAIQKTLDALDATLDILSTLVDDGSNKKKPVTKPYIPREKLIGENISTVGMTHIYKYVHENGGVFNSENVNLDECSRYKNSWLEHGYSPCIKEHISIHVRRNSARANSKHNLDNACIASMFGGYTVLCQDEIDYFDKLNLIDSVSQLKKRKVK